MRICEQKFCIGCMACGNICPRDAIDVISDSNGFYKVSIDESKCIKCGLCVRNCPNNINFEALYEKMSIPDFAIAAWSKDKKTRKISTSGGVFSEFAHKFIEKNGIVVGAVYNNHKVYHTVATNETELARMRGSKYVQSDVGGIYREIKEYLEKDRYVLFSGTPCQVFALNRFMGKKYDNLVTIDLICHGVPSPRVFGDYCNYMEEKYSNKISKIFFRNKKPGWVVYGMKIIFDNNEVYENDTKNDPYLVGFLRDYFINDGCHNCHFTNVKRFSDITIADFWGYTSNEYEFLDDDKGISLILLNTEKGRRLFDDIKDSVKYQKKDIEMAIRGNRCLTKPFPPNVHKNKFWKDYNTVSFEQIIDKYFYPEPMPKFTMVQKIKKCFTVRQRYVMKKLLSKIPGIVPLVHVCRRIRH